MRTPTHTRRARTAPSHPPTSVHRSHLVPTNTCTRDHSAHGSLTRPRISHTRAPAPAVPHSPGHAQAQQPPHSHTCQHKPELPKRRNGMVSRASPIAYDTRLPFESTRLPLESVRLPFELAASPAGQQTTLETSPHQGLFRDQAHRQSTLSPIAYCPCLLPSPIALAYCHCLLPLPVAIAYRTDLC